MKEKGENNNIHKLEQTQEWGNACHMSRHHSVITGQVSNLRGMMQLWERESDDI